MALYQGLNRPREEAPPRAARPSAAAAPGWRSLQAHTQATPGSPARQGHWLDTLLGQGSRRALSGGANKKAAEAAVPPRWREKKFQALGAPEALPRGRRGVIRSFLAALALCMAVMALKPWRRQDALRADISALFSAPSPKELAATALEERRLAQEEARRLAALPVLAGGGSPLALWQDGEGRWWSVQSDGLLSQHAGPGAKEALGLPELKGAVARFEEHGKGKRLRLDLGGLDLGGLLPLQAALAAEVRTLQLGGPDGPVLLTHDGTRCLLGGEAWEQRQERLSLVLADLGARGRRAGTVDLRFEDTAVVR